MANSAPSWRDAVLVQRYLFANHDRVARVIRGAGASRSMTDAILAYTRGDLSYAALRRRMLFRFPMTVFRMARERLGVLRARAS